MFNKRINIFVGHFGSGKTEVSLNYALHLAEKGNKTTIVDLDIVNPFFRTADAEDEIKKRGIHLIKPIYSNTNMDVPALPGEINSVFENKDRVIVLDIGGDDLGAKAVSRYRDEILKNEYEIHMVINTKRPMTNTVDKILGIIEEIERSSRFKITKLVNNTNLMQFTTLNDVIEGHKLIELVSKQTDIPIGFVSILNENIDVKNYDFSTEVLLLNKMIKVPWKQ